MSEIPGPSPEEMGVTPEKEETEPTSEQLAKAVAEVLDPEDCQELVAMDFDEACGYAFTLLLENGIEDPETFLREKGILL